MKTSLEHLPLNKRDELQVIVQIIREKFDVEMIILFGSYARGDSIAAAVHTVAH
jgi:predicted nucleotidyltransferase